MEHRELEKKQDWAKKGKKYKTKYFDRLKQLFGEIEHDKESQLEVIANGRPGTNSVCDMANQARD